MPKDTVLSIRISPADRELIAARAKEAGLSQSDYVLQKTLGRRTGRSEMSARVADLEARVKKLEEPGRGWVPA
jgi:hypothetical protein